MIKVLNQFACMISGHKTTSTISPISQMKKAVQGGCNNFPRLQR